MSTIPAVPTSYTTGDQYKSDANKAWESELNTLDTLPNAFAQLIYIMFVMMPTKEKSIGGEMEYQDYLMDQVSDQLIPRLDSIKEDFNSCTGLKPEDVVNSLKGFTFGKDPGSCPGSDAVSEANSILQLVYLNPNLASNSQLQANVTSAISDLMTTGLMYNGLDNNYVKIVMTSVPMNVTVNGTEETVDVPQIQGEYCANSASGQPTDDWQVMSVDGTGWALEAMWSGTFEYTHVASGSQQGKGEGLSSYENMIQEKTADMNELSTTFTDFSKTATSVFQFFMGEEKQMLSILDNCLQDISKGEQQAINNEITS
ncbi:hypothetical protein [Simkania negevensis]|uniref:Uncharacterized protein n=1 Tax=Simkania negevensis (strain ATCC VR-1471 / DSM 27360 / Z) TaxID=331113 RepID=F8L3J8_SIMNZ|nr:hypothetical protein [Simkania negevensis]CCB89857.1 unknown protein [Simkania negevensis Z]